MCGGGVPQVVHRGEVSRSSCNNLPQLALLPPPDRGLIKSEAYATVSAQQSLGLAKPRQRVCRAGTTGDLLHN